MESESTAENGKYRDISLEGGKFFAHPKPGDEVVISGLAGEYPLSENVEKFAENLFNKACLTDPKYVRWNLIHPEIPRCTGNIFNAELFDAGFFGLSYRQAYSMDPMQKLMLEKSIECIFDAGINPADLEGTKTGVFISACSSESEQYWLLQNQTGYEPFPGCARSMIANRISKTLKLDGPSFVCDTACSSSLYALEVAYRAMRLGQCENAIVGGVNLVLHPLCTLQFARLGVLSKEGVCRPFDVDGKGYVRSEAVCAVFLQKSKIAKRIYASVVHVKTNCDGYKEQGITYPSTQTQTLLLKEFYNECGVNPSDMSYLEAHGTGTIVGDPEELKSIEIVFTPGRKTPLWLGSVKSNIGHSEPVSGLCSITKAIIAFETGYIPPNIHFTKPRQGVKILEDGKAKVVTEKIPFEDKNGLIAVNSFGFGGANGHILLKMNPKKKPKSKSVEPRPQIVCVSARTQTGVISLLDHIENKNFDPEHVRLVQDAFSKNIALHMYRGFAIKSNGTVNKYFGLKKRMPLYFAFGELNYDFVHSLKDVLHLPIFDKVIGSLKYMFSNKDLTLRKVLQNNIEMNTNDKIVASLGLQISLALTLKELNVIPDGFMGYSFGILVSEYTRGNLSLDNLVKCALVLGDTLVHEDFKKKQHEITLKLEKALTDGKSINSVSLVRNIVDAITYNTVHQLRESSVILKIGNLPLKVNNNITTLSLIEPGKNGINHFVETIGRLYQIGYDPDILKLQPEIEFPVSRGTPMISPQIKWNHLRDWFLYQYREDKKEDGVQQFKIALKDPWKYTGGHVIDGRNLFPATGYLYIVWDTFARSRHRSINDLSVTFENCKFKRACSVPKEGDKNYLELDVMVQKGSGNFEVFEGGVAVVTGRVTMGIQEECNIPKISPDNDEILMNKKDIYKELRLRGYNYKGLFTNLTECNTKGTIGKIKWDNNWVAFADNMLQMKILQEDTRLLYVPVKIAKIIINPQKHGEIVDKLSGGDNVLLPVYVNRETGIIKSGGTEIRGLVASSITRKKNQRIPVLEKYQFIPNETKLDLLRSVRVNLQIILENSLEIKIKVAELIDEATEIHVPLSPTVKESLEDQPLIRPEITILSTSPVEADDIKVEDRKLKGETDCMLVIASKMFGRKQVYLEALAAIKSNGYLISREPLNFNPNSVPNDAEIITIHKTDKETLVFFTSSKVIETPVTVNVSTSNNFNWLPVLQDAVKNSSNVMVYAENEPLSGILGLVNCIRREPGCSHVRCVFIMDKAPSFDYKDDFYRKQLKKNLAINVYMNGQWGTYRHLLLAKEYEVECEDFCINQLVRGDLSTLRCMESPLARLPQLAPDDILVDIQYASINFKDIMLASGKINVDVIVKDRKFQESVLGFEFSGTTQSGKRVMGFSTRAALSTKVLSDPALIWEIPDSWTLEDAATVPAVYGTCIFGLIITGKIKPTDSILIHSGTGGIGQAAINLCLKFGCKVYTTVGTQEKVEFIKKHFPQLKDSQIGNSRDLSFEQQIMRETNGRGVDVVLNSLSEEKLLASIRCLARGGRFLEIGKFDIAADNRINLLLMEKGASFHGVMFDLILSQPLTMKRELKKVVGDCISKGLVKPLIRTVFKSTEVEQAFRYMAAGKHMGKVLLKIRDDEARDGKIGQLHKTRCIPRYYCDSNEIYIICGGLGGFGLELADWLILRGARKLVLTSRSGVKTGYQKYRINLWQSYGCEVKISTVDITTREGCKRLIDEANEMGPVVAIFNLAVVLRDAILENQTEESFADSLGPKAYATQYLDEVTRLQCPELRDFVIFSSVSCGRGNAGQSNYGMANSVMERICEKRRLEGYPGLAIEWGAIGDVGLVAEMQEEHFEMEIGGTLQQSISNCLEVMDFLLKQKEAAVVSSIVVAEKNVAGNSDNAVGLVANILGIRDLKAVSFQSTLAELGMDSMTAVEIKQTLEREFEIFLTPQEIRSVTLARIQEIDETRSGSEAITTEISVPQFEFLNKIIKNPEEGDMDLNVPVVHLSESKETLHAMIYFPGIEGTTNLFNSFAQKLEADVYGIQYCAEIQGNTIVETAENIIICLLNKKLISKSIPFRFIAHSFGSCVALEVSKLLEEAGYIGSLTLLDGSPKLMTILMAPLNMESQEVFETSLMMRMLGNITTISFLDTHKEDIEKCSNFTEKIEHLLELLDIKSFEVKKYYLDRALSVYRSVKYTLSGHKPTALNSTIRLYKASLKTSQNIVDDYGLSEYAIHPVEVKVFEGDHVSILNNDDMVKEVNQWLICNGKEFK